MNSTHMVRDRILDLLCSSKNALESYRDAPYFEFSQGPLCRKTPGPDSRPLMLTVPTPPGTQKEANVPRAMIIQMYLHHGGTMNHVGLEQPKHSGITVVRTSLIRESDLAREQDPRGFTLFTEAQLSSH